MCTQAALPCLVVSPAAPVGAATFNAPTHGLSPHPALWQGSRKHYCVNMHATKQSSIDEACEELLKESQVGAGRRARDLLRCFTM